MQKIRSVKFNFLMNLILTGSNFLFPLITFPYVSRILGPEGTGKVAFATSFVTYFVMFASFGVATYGVRAVAQVRDNKELLTKTTQEILIINILIMSFSYLIFFIFLLQSEKLWQEKELITITSFLIIFTILGVEWFYKGIEQYQYITIRTIILRFIALIITFIFINAEDDYVIFGAITVFATVGSSIINLFRLKDYISFKIYKDYNFSKHFKPMTLLFLTSFAIAIYTNTDATMLGFMRNDVDVGFYNAAVRVKAILLGVVTSLGVVLLPRLSYYIEHNMISEFNVALNKSVNFIMLISLPVAVFFMLFAKETILVLAGESYHASILPLQIIMTTIVLVGITNILGIQVLLPLKRDSALLISVIVAAITDILLNLFFIPKLGATGAAISTTIAELAVLLIQCYFVRSCLTLLFSGIQYIKIIFSIVISAIFSKIIGEYLSLPVFVKLTIVGITFFSIYFVILFLLKERFLSENIFSFFRKKYLKSCSN